MLEIMALIVGDQLRLECSYSETVHRRVTIERLVDDFMDSLRMVIEHCLSPEVGGFTPADFPEAHLSQEKLDSFLTSIRRRSQ